jgi:hypothetical protein
MLRSAWLSRRQPPRRRASPAPPRSDNGLYVSYAPVIVVILAFNFLGDGLRDAADPYG